jgi:hypothetical protein
MANVLTSVFTGLRDNLSRLEALLVSAISTQAVVASLVAGIPQVAKYVDGAFAAAAVLALLVKNFLANTGGTPPVPTPAPAPVPVPPAILKP